MYCSAHHVGIAVHDDWLFQDVSVEIHEGHRIALVGPNGGGKTTLLRLLAKQSEPDTGTVAWKKELRLGLLHQIPSYSGTVKEVLHRAFADIYSIEQKMRALEAKMASPASDRELERILKTYAALQEEFDNLDGYSIDSRVRSITTGIGIPEALLQSEFSLLSGGEQTKVEFARLLLSRPELLLLDEPTNHLDLPAVEWLESFLETYAGAVLVVSHDRYFLNRVVNRVMELDNGAAALYQGNYSQAMEEREKQLLLEFQAFEEQQKKIKQMQAAIKRLRIWANQASPPSAALHRRATNMQRALDRMEKIDKPQLERKQMDLSFDVQERSGKDVATAMGLQKRYGDTVLLNEVSFHVRFGERVAIVGTNGSGKSTLVKMLLGEISADAGDVRLGDSVRAGYLSQAGLAMTGDEDKTVLDAFRDEAKVHQGKARHILAQFLFYGEAVFKPIKRLSGGERMRLRLAQLMHQDINLLILDEPTNHLDIESREALEVALDEFTGTIIAVSHDRHFINQLFQRVLWLEDGKLQSYHGNYDDARRKRFELLAAKME
ncbi:ABC-F type ribosomal protection protein [Alicyclobacillus sp. SO9]|nr:ABC-F type ribosomal protection protein [Alicyclobacillus sp. SO9]